MCQGGLIQRGKSIWSAHLGLVNSFPATIHSVVGLLVDKSGGSWYHSLETLGSCTSVVKLTHQQNHLHLNPDKPEDSVLETDHHKVSIVIFGIVYRDWRFAMKYPWREMEDN